MIIRLIIADDHRLIRDGLKSLLKNEKEIEIVDEVEDGLELLEKLETVKADVVLMDVSMPKLNGIESTIRLSEEYPHVKVIMLSMHEEPEYILKCVQSGAYSYLLKNVEKEELINAIVKASQGQKYFNATVSQLLAQGLSEQKKQQKEEVDITTREKEVLECVINGLSTKQMADKLFISTRTVETHRLNLLKKFNAHNTAELIKYALERKIVSIF
ncbi:MAG: response regulator transcription factor [Bacteroidota bacterium]|nr:response regulator transcription factor [Bacteroidota bacterium]